jgi:hypothetical protein
LVPAVLRAKVVVNIGNGSISGSKKGNSVAAAAAAGKRKKGGRSFSSTSSSSSGSNLISPNSPYPSAASSVITSASLRAPAPSRRNVIARDNATCEGVFFWKVSRFSFREREKESDERENSLTLFFLFLPLNSLSSLYIY